MKTNREAIHNANNALMVAMGQIEVLRRRFESKTLTEEDFTKLLDSASKSLEKVQDSVDHLTNSQGAENVDGKNS